MREPEVVTASEAGVWIEVADAGRLAAQTSAAGEAPFGVAVKANIAVRGFRRSAGCRVLDVRPEDADAPVVAAFRRHGGVVVGTANMHELALGVTSDNVAYGAARVPAAPHLSAGGSSGGSAAAVAAGLVPVALGTDTGGSVSIPASHCGVVGFRPSTGRWSTAGIVGLSWTRDTPGVFARTVREAIRADGWVTGARTPTTLGRVRLGIPRQLVDDLHPATEEAFRRAIAAMSASIDVVEVDFAPVLARTVRAEPGIVEFEAPRELGAAAACALGLPPGEAFDALRRGVQSPDVAAFLEHVHRHPVSAADYARAQEDTLEARRLSEDVFARHDLHAMVFPTTPASAPPSRGGTAIVHRGREQSVFALYTRHTGPGTILGAPMVTVPIPVEGDPIGLTVQGRRNDDARTLAVADLVAGLLSSGR